MIDRKIDDLNPIGKDIEIIDIKMDEIIICIKKLAKYSNDGYEN